MHDVCTLYLAQSLDLHVEEAFTHAGKQGTRMAPGTGMHPLHRLSPQQGVLMSPAAMLCSLFILCIYKR